MVNVRPNLAPPDEPGRARFNVLLTRDREQNIEHWTRQLPRLMEPMGVRAFVATTGRQALDLATEHAIHAALIDLATPAGHAADEPGASRQDPGGLWLLEVMARRPQRPPVVVVNSRTFTPAQADRLLSRALKLGAFSVINRPSQLDELLLVIQRLIDRTYRGQWPTHQTQPTYRPESSRGTTN